MVIKTDTCFFTELKIFPGHGRRLVRRDGKLLAFINRKSRSLYLQRKKAQTIRWTQAWRRKHKKTKVETFAKKRGKRQARVFRSIQGISLEDLQARRAKKPEQRKAEQEVRQREVAAAQKKKQETKQKAAKAFDKAVASKTNAGFVKVPKQRRTMINKAAAGGKR